MLARRTEHVRQRFHDSGPAGLGQLLRRRSGGLCFSVVGAVGLAGFGVDDDLEGLAVLLR